MRENVEFEAPEDLFDEAIPTSVAHEAASLTDDK